MTTDGAAPRLSIVVCGRNDDYGLTFKARFQSFLRHLSDNADKALFELIVVEWNPPAGAPPLAKAFDWSGLEDVARIVTVPAEAHDAILNPGRMPLLEFWAKNVGVRRARAPFVLSTNPDIIHSPKFFEFIRRGNLDPKAFYRADRYDLAPDLVFEAPGEQIFGLAKQAVFEIHTRNPVDPEEPMSYFVDPATPIDEWPQSQPIFGDELAGDGAAIVSGQRRDPLAGLHTQASGDFIMASKQAWAAVRGHWERTDTFTHLDSYLICHLHAAGYRQHILRRPVMVLHMDHSRDEQKSRPVRPYSEWAAEIRQAAAGALPNPNDDNWGLAHLDLPETRPGRRAARAPEAAPAPAAKSISVAAHLKQLSRAEALAAARRVAALRKQSGLEQQVLDLRAQLDNATAEAVTRDAIEQERAAFAAQVAAAQALADSRAAQLEDLQRAIAQAAAEAAGAIDAKTNEISALQQALAQAQSEISARADASSKEIGVLQAALAQTRAETTAQIDAMDRELAMLQTALAQAAADAVAQAGASAQEISALRQALAEASEHHANDRSATHNSVAEAEARAAAIKAALETLTLERDDLSRALALERALAAENLAQRDAFTQRIAQMQAEVEHAHKVLRDAAASHAAERAAADARYEGLVQQLGLLRAEELAQVRGAFEQRIAQLRAENDDAHNALQAIAATHAAERGAADARYEDLVRQLDLMRTELAQVRGAYEQRIAQLRAEADDAHIALDEVTDMHAAERAAADARYDALARQFEAFRTEELAHARAKYAEDLARITQALQEAEDIARQMDDERKRHVKEAEHALGRAVQSGDAERARREAAEGILQAIEDETVERERRIAALETELAAAQRTAAEAVAARDSALASYTGIVENSRYLKARRALMRLLGRG